jgi:hypothetical protein
MATVPGDPTATVRLPTGEEILITREFAAPPPPGLSGVDHARPGQAVVGW